MTVFDFKEIVLSAYKSAKEQAKIEFDTTGQISIETKICKRILASINFAAIQYLRNQNYSKYD